MPWTRSRVAEEAAHAILAQLIEQDVGQGGAGLALPGRQSWNAVREMQWQTRVDRQDQHVVIPIFSGGGADSDLVRPGAARRDEFADPPQGLDCLGARRGAGDDLRRRRCRPRIGAKLTGEPGGIGVAGIAPVEPHLMRQGGEQRTPNRGDADEAIKFDRTKDRWRVRHAPQGGIAQIARRQDTRR